MFTEGVVTGARLDKGKHDVQGVAYNSVSSLGLMAMANQVTVMDFKLEFLHVQLAI
jgi:hypothetical protein